MSEDNKPSILETALSFTASIIAGSSDAPEHAKIWAALYLEAYAQAYSAKLRSEAIEDLVRAAPMPKAPKTNN